MTDDTGFDSPDAEHNTGHTADQSGLDLSPRQVDVTASSGRKRFLPMLVLAGVVLGLGFILLQTLGSAALFFYNADEAVERRDELVEQRFRVQGTPFGAPVAVEVDRNGRLEQGVVFPIRYEGTVVDVVHVGSPAELFQPGVPVVLEGTWQTGLPGGVDDLTDGANDGWHFASTEMIVKHDNEYRNDNEERINEADRGGFAPEA